MKSISRRDRLYLMLGAGLAVAGAAGCSELRFDLAGSADGGFAPDASNGRPNVVFVSSETFAPIFLTSAVADGHCNRLASAAGLVGTFAAWWGRDRFGQDPLGTSRGWVRLDGRSVADQVAQLKDGTVFRPVLLTETGAAVPAGTQVATGTALDGSSDIENDCGDYMQPREFISAGDATQTGTAMFYGQRVRCDQPTRIYCFEYGREVIALEGE